jgi:3-oxoacyl-[acyl-carrier protein] reductase
MRLKDHVVLITGAGRGIGRATAERMAAEGAIVGVFDRDQASVDITVAAIASRDGKAIGIVGDVTKRADIEAAAAKLTDAHGAIDVLINNAGITRDSTLLKMTETQWDEVIDINLKAVFTCTQVVAPGMVARGKGRVINIASIVGVYGNFGQTNYAAAKAGVIGMTKTWARELGRKGVTVNAIAPGFIKTELVTIMPENVLEGMRQRVPMGRLGEPSEIAASCVFLASDDAAYINGHVLGVDGGMTL